MNNDPSNRLPTQRNTAANMSSSPHTHQSIANEDLAVPLGNPIRQREAAHANPAVKTGSRAKRMLSPASGEKVPSGFFSDDSPRESRFNIGRDDAAARRSRNRGQRASGTDGPALPELYRHALNSRWVPLMTRATKHPREAEYVNPAEGFTALHLAVISRVCRPDGDPSNETVPSRVFRRRSSTDSRAAAALAAAAGSQPHNPESRSSASLISADSSITVSTSRSELNDASHSTPPSAQFRPVTPAPIDAIRALLIAYPDAVTMRCTLNGYTPLAYACLVPPPEPKDSNDGDDDDKSAARQKPSDSPKADDNEMEEGFEDEFLDNGVKESGFNDEDEDEEDDDLTPKAANVQRARRKGHRTIYQDVLLEGGALPLTLADSEELVRLILEHRRDCAGILTKDGLSVLDVHIASFSRTRGEETDSEEAGKTTTGVLRALLEADPALGSARMLASRTNMTPSAFADHEDGRGSQACMTIGPLERLYRYNAYAFLNTLAKEDEIHRENRQLRGRGRRGRVAGGGGSERARTWYEHHAPAESRSESINSTLSSWWVWKWTILLLKYGKKKKRGARFQAVHAAASVFDCPLPLLQLTVRAFPNQIREEDMMLGDGNLPLHIVSAWRRSHVRNEGHFSGSSDSDATTLSRKGMVICALLSEFPDAARVTNKLGRTPLSLAVESGTLWDSGVRRLVRAFPEAVSVQDKETGLFPFMLAATYCGEDEHDGSNMEVGASRHARSKVPPSLTADRTYLYRLRTVYELLRLDPGVIDACLNERAGESSHRRSSRIAFADFTR